jgi:predicted protein tyrosine phosphatase
VIVDIVVKEDWVHRCILTRKPQRLAGGRVIVVAGPPDNFCFSEKSLVYSISSIMSLRLLLIICVF